MPLLPIEQLGLAVAAGFIIASIFARLERTAYRRSLAAEARAPMREAVEIEGSYFYVMPEPEYVRMDALRQQLRAANQALHMPVPMLLYCPACGLQHVDAPEIEAGWTNPPHRSHKCASCRHIWRPSDRHTVGVAKISTAGAADSLLVVPLVTERLAARRRNAGAA